MVQFKHFEITKQPMDQILAHKFILRAECLNIVFIYLSKFSSNEGKAARRNQQAVQLTIERLFFTKRKAL